MGATAACAEGGDVPMIDFASQLQEPTDTAAFAGRAARGADAGANATVSPSCQGPGSSGAGGDRGCCSGGSAGDSRETALDGDPVERAPQAPLHIMHVHPQNAAVASLEDGDSSSDWERDALLLSRKIEATMMPRSAKSEGLPGHYCRQDASMEGTVDSAAPPRTLRVESAEALAAAAGTARSCGTTGGGPLAGGERASNVEMMRRGPATPAGGAGHKRKSTSVGAETPKLKSTTLTKWLVGASCEEVAAGGCEAGMSNEAALLALTNALRESAWREALAGELAQPYFAQVARFVAEERARHMVYPEADKVFEAFNLTPLSELKVVVIGQDPYHEPGQAHGLCFSVLPGVPPPPSLKNIYKELAADIQGFKVPAHGHLVQWAQQGVLLLNATLTVRSGHTEANSHAGCGWQRFTDAVIQVINKRRRGVVFLLWGGFAQKKGKLVDRSRHAVLEAAHPSPLSARKWHGCRIFSKCNEALRAHGQAEVRWLLD